MLSNPLHRFSPYHTVPSSTLYSNGHVPNNPPHPAGLHEMPQGYPIQHMQPHVGVQHPHMAARSAPGPPQPKSRHHPYGPGTRASGSSGPVRRRISRACDQCNQLRTKCDGQHPCAHCIGELFLVLCFSYLCASRKKEIILSWHPTDQVGQNSA